MGNRKTTDPAGTGSTTKPRRGGEKDGSGEDDASPAKSGKTRAKHGAEKDGPARNAASTVKKRRKTSAKHSAEKDGPARNAASAVKERRKTKAKHGAGKDEPVQDGASAVKSREAKTEPDAPGKAATSPAADQKDDDDYAGVVFFNEEIDENGHRSRDFLDENGERVCLIDSVRGKDNGWPAPEKRMFGPRPDAQTDAMRPRGKQEAVLSDALSITAIIAEIAIDDIAGYLHAQPLAYPRRVSDATAQAKRAVCAVIEASQRIDLHRNRGRRRVRISQVWTSGDEAALPGGAHDKPGTEDRHIEIFQDLMEQLVAVMQDLETARAEETRRDRHYKIAAGLLSDANLIIAKLIGLLSDAIDYHRSGGIKHVEVKHMTIKEVERVGAGPPKRARAKDAELPVKDAQPYARRARGAR